MNITETKSQFLFQSEDVRGSFEFRIHKDLSQIQLETELEGFGEEAFADINYESAIVLRELLNMAIENYEKQIV